MGANPEWYYSKDKRQLGPVSATDLKKMASTGLLSASDLIWKEGMADWKQAGTIKGLFRVENPEIPPSPPWLKSSASSPSPTETSSNSPSAPSESPVVVALWNPFAARAWSLLFTPVFGSYLMMMNWKTLGDDVRAKHSMLWFYTCLTFVILGIITPNTPNLIAVFRFIGCLIFVAWACTDAEKQVKYVKEKFGSSYVRKSWWKPLGFGIGAVFVFVMILGMIDFSSDSANISLVKGGQLDSYPEVTVGQLVDNFLGNPHWSDFTGENGENFVNAKGKMALQGKEVQAHVQFVVHGKRFELNAFEMNGIPQNNLMKAALFQKMYEEYRKSKPSAPVVKTNDTKPQTTTSDTNPQTNVQVAGDKYDRIKDGMTQRDVEAILGIGKEQMASGNLKAYTWNQSNGDVISIVFNKGRVSGKSR